MSKCKLNLAHKPEGRGQDTLCHPVWRGWGHRVSVQGCLKCICEARADRSDAVTMGYIMPVPKAVIFHRGFCQLACLLHRDFLLSLFLVSYVVPS